MTDDRYDDDLRLGARIAAREQLYETMLDSNVTEHAIDFLARATTCWTNHRHQPIAPVLGMPAPNTQPYRIGTSGR